VKKLQLQLHEADRCVVGADAEYLVTRRALAPIERPFRRRLRTFADHDVDDPHRRCQPLDGLGVADGQRRTPHQIVELGAATDTDDAQLAQVNRVGAELLDARPQRAVEAADERRHADDRRDADDDAEHGQPGSHLVRAQGLQRHAQDFAEQPPIHV
jgi:hypothetical protein